MTRCMTRMHLEQAPGMDTDNALPREVQLHSVHNTECHKLQRERLQKGRLGRKQMVKKEDCQAAQKAKASAKLEAEGAFHKAAQEAAEKKEAEIEAKRRRNYVRSTVNSRKKGCLDDHARDDLLRDISATSGQKSKGKVSTDKISPTTTPMGMLNSSIKHPPPS